VVFNSRRAATTLRHRAEFEISLTTLIADKYVDPLV